MNTSLLEPRKALNKAFLKIKPNRSFIENFKSNLITVLNSINKGESEEHHKILMMDFFKKTYYDPQYYINTKGKTDWVIHNGKDARSAAGVIIETKSPANSTEMVSLTNLNKKALHELLLYYLRERITHKNLDVRYLIITNIYEWFIFDAQHFDKLFAQNKELVRRFKDCEENRSSDSSTKAFYKEIAEPFIASLPATLEFTHFDIRNYEKALRNTDKEDDRQLIALYKLLSPEHLLKLSFANDSNSLDKNFYAELLHIIGLTETKEAGKKLIQRNKPGHRNSGSLIENTILQLESMDKLSRLDKPEQYGNSPDERLFSIAMELTITWVNRILFLKLLEGQLISYHKGNKEYSFLHPDKIKDYDNLNTLFFQVLAKKSSDRNVDVQKLFANVPYLNSSLFEMTETEHAMFSISQLEDNKSMRPLPNTVIKDVHGRKVGGDLNALHYFLAFLDAYDFSSEGSEEIQEDNKTLINASVLGLIFEKINGYKDGSFFTPGFITMYMCRESIRKAVVQKFNEVKGWDCNDFLDLYNQKYTIEEANKIINSIKICDPAVGSGHFLVSALNEIISIKSKLEILCDKDGRLLKHYDVIIENDELMVFDNRDGSFFQYNPLSVESRRIQETLFKEKQTIIENCLFGVDINSNSVKICRLRLWIELLKNSFYKEPDFRELETLPNIDINIKTGNSLISRFPLDADLKKALKESKWNIDSYKLAVATYRDAESKEQKHAMEKLISDIKNNFRVQISSKEKGNLDKAKGELIRLTTQTNLFGRSKKEETEWNKQVKAKVLEIAKCEKEIEDIRANKMYENAFEWRFEFPEVLDDGGNYKGFDVIIGNPPYIQLQKMGQSSMDLEKMRYSTYNKTGDIYSLFYELGFRLLKVNGLLAFITSNKWMRAAYGESLRKYLIEKSNPFILVDFGGMQVFDTATVDTNILISEKAEYTGTTQACVLDKNFSINNTSDYIRQHLTPTSFSSSSWVVLSPLEGAIKKKIEDIGTPLKEWDLKIYRGILTGYNEAFIIDQQTRDRLINASPKNAEIIRPILRGRDIKKYDVHFSKLYLINAHNGVKEQGTKRIDIVNDYPVIYEYLKHFQSKLETRRDKGDHWSNLRNCAYIDIFTGPKLIYPETMRLLKNSNETFPRFTYDSGNYFCDKTAFSITGNEVKYLLGFMNSKIMQYLIPQYVTAWDDSGFMMQKIYLENIPIPNPEKKLKDSIEILVDKILIEKEILKKKELQRNIDDIFSDIFSFSEDEEAFIDLRIRN